MVFFIPIIISAWSIKKLITTLEKFLIASLVSARFYIRLINSESTVSSEMSDTVSKKAIKSIIIKTGRIIITFTKIDSANSHARIIFVHLFNSRDRFSFEKNSREKERRGKKRKEKRKRNIKISSNDKITV